MVFGGASLLLSTLVSSQRGYRHLQGWVANIAGFFDDFVGLCQGNLALAPANGFLHLVVRTVSTPAQVVQRPPNRM